MRRTVLTIVATVVGLVMLLSFKTRPAGNSAGGGLASLGTVPASSQPRQTTARHKPRHRRSVAPKPAKTHAATTISATGQTIQTRYGPVQVRITETSGRLTNVVAVQLPSGSSHSSQIASHAAPILRSEALKAGSAHIDVVSGATYTSDGYAQSLQSALDKA